jgi:hypothetical protein
VISRSGQSRNGSPSSSVVSSEASSADRSRSRLVGAPLSRDPPTPQSSKYRYGRTKKKVGIINDMESELDSSPEIETAHLSSSRMPQSLSVEKAKRRKKTRRKW